MATKAPKAYPSSRTKAVRPLRGTPEQTRERFLDVASDIFNEVGYHGTDSNDIAHKAGYATGTFYKHFKDKKELFLAVYERWVSSEWKAVESAINSGSNPHQIAIALVDLSIAFHTKWRGLRASVVTLVFTDNEVRQFYRNQRRKQLDMMARIRTQINAPDRTREMDAIHLFTTERVFDALANGEIQALGLDRRAVVADMVSKVESLLTR